MIATVGGQSWQQPPFQGGWTRWKAGPRAKLPAPLALPIMPILFDALQLGFFRSLRGRGHLLESTLPFFEDRNRRGGAEARASCLIDFERFIQRAHSPRSFDLNARIGMRAHQAQVLDGRAGWGEACRGFDEIGANAAADPAGDDLQLVGEISVLKDHLENRALLAAGVGHLL